MKLILQYIVYFIGVGGFILFFKAIFDYDLNIVLICVSLFLILGAMLVAGKISDEQK